MESASTEDLFEGMCGKVKYYEDLTAPTTEVWFVLWQSDIPEVSDAEQTEIELSVGHPSDYDRKAFVDMTDWLSE